MAVEKHCTLKQGNCKKCILSRHNKTTIIKPPIEDPDTEKDKYWLLKRILYGLCHSPRHLYAKFHSILSQLGLCMNAWDPCLFTGQVVNPLDPTVLATSLPLTLGLYIDDFVYFSKDPCG